MQCRESIARFLEEALPFDSIIPLEKITRYLLVPQESGDKAAFLALGGFWPANPHALANALAEIRTLADAEAVRDNKFGRYFEAVGVLRGPSGTNLWVKTIWMTEHLSGKTKFITLVPISVCR